MMCSLDLQGNELCKLVRSELGSSDPISAAAVWGLVCGHCADSNLQMTSCVAQRDLTVACACLLFGHGPYLTCKHDGLTSIVVL